MEIKIKPRETAMGFRFRVSLIENGFEKVYNVTMDKDFLLLVGTHFDPVKIVKKTFEFLLEKEPKEKILEEFDINTVSHYYPEFIAELLKRMDY
jgi:hypothetical protein